MRVVSDTAIRILRSGPKETLEETSTIEKTDVLDRVLVDDGAYNNISGLDTQLDTISSMSELPLHSPSIFTDVGLQPPKGVLMYGPPGTGKTMIARAVAKSCDATFLSINGAELLSNVVGESELALRQVFDRALRAQPAVIFIDEIDAVGPRRDRAAEDIDKRMVATLLPWTASILS